MSRRGDGKKQPRIPGQTPPKKSVPRFDAGPTGKHAAVTGGEFDYRNAKPSWRFQYVDHEGWGFDNTDGTTVTALLQTLASFESMTLPEIFGGDHPGKHYDVETAHDNIKTRLAELRREDETRVSRLRLSGKQRLYGFLRDDVFYVLWWDPEHELWPSPKKRT